MAIGNIRELLPRFGLKVTPQRIAVYEAIMSRKDHPTAENIIDYVRERYPNIAVGTVYNTLETFVEKGIIYRVKSEGDIMRYDGITENHHHLYSIDSGRIEDYYDEELSHWIEDYFSRKEIPGFSVSDVRVQIMGEFRDNQSV